MDRIREFWAEARTATPFMQSGEKLRQYYNGWHVAWTALFGRPTIFRHRWPGFWAALPGTPNDIALYDHAPLRSTLNRLVDFDRLNSAGMRLTVNCVDVETGEEVVFDNTRHKIEAHHILASTAITPGFPPVEIDGRMLCDPGYVNNTPFDLAFIDPPDVDTLCIVIELFCLHSPRPKSLDAVLERTQDIMFASTTKRSLAALRREYDLRARLSENLPVIQLLHSVYQTAPHELSMKTLDFSSSSIADRWAAGVADLSAGLQNIRQKRLGPGFNYISCNELQPVSHADLGEK